MEAPVRIRIARVKTESGEIKEVRSVGAEACKKVLLQNGETLIDTLSASVDDYLSDTELDSAFAELESVRNAPKVDISEKVR
jgi:hypothetical protein